MPENETMTARKAGALVRKFIKDNELPCGPVKAETVGMSDLLRRDVLCVEVFGVDTTEIGAKLREEFRNPENKREFTIRFRSNVIAWC